MPTYSQNKKIFFLFSLSYLAIIFGVLGSGEQTLKNLHMGLETSNVILSLLLALFLWDNIHATQQHGRRYLSAAFGFAAATGLMDIAVDVEWSGWLIWVVEYSPVLSLSSWSLSTYLLAIGLLWSLWLIRSQSTLSLRIYMLGMGAFAAALFLAILYWPMFTGKSGEWVQQPMQLPLAFLWLVVAIAYWRERHSHPLFAGCAMMGVYMCVAALAMSYSNSSYEQFATIAHIGKLIGYGVLNAALMGRAVDDAHARVEAEANFFAEKQQLQVTLDSIGDGVITTNTKSQVTYLNPVAEKMTGWRNVEAVGLPLEQIFQVVGERRRQIDTSKPFAATERNNATLVRRDGVEFTIDDSSTPMYADDGKVTGMVLVFRDVSAMRKATEEINHLAKHDALTGLINRHELESQVLLSFKGLGRHHTLLHLDLDQFQIINDTCGHVAGDELLRQMAKLMSTLVRSDDVLARLGGDKFGVLLQGCSMEQGEHIAEKFRAAVSQYVFEWQGRVFSSAVSIGLVNFSDATHSNMDVMVAADTACYIAKDLGRNRVHVYRADDRDVMSRHGELAWIERIHYALKENRLRLYRQEIVRVGGEEEEDKHYELLIRMLDDNDQVIAPAAFIPAAERYNLMPMIDRWVVRAAFGMYRAGNHEMWSINLSGASINDEQFLPYLLEQFKNFNVPPKAICFEVTETSAITNLSSAGYFIRELRALGCSFSLDDFGSGMSSFGYLKYLPVDYLKIDGGFVKDMEHDLIDYAMVDAINKVGQVMGLKTIAEFVENEAIRRLLKELGVDYVQGYGIGKPKPF